MSKNLQVEWTFSTGVLRGHEGGPLVIGDVMYVHTPFPNIVYALDLNNDGGILWKYEPKQDPNVIPVMCCDTVNRGVAYGDGKIILQPGRHHGGGAGCQDRQVVVGEERRSGSKGETGTARADRRQGQGPDRHLGRRVRRARLGRGLQSEGRLAGLAAYSMGPDSDTLIDPEKTTHPRQAGRQGFRHGDLGRRAVEDRRRHDLGLVLL